MKNIWKYLTLFLAGLSAGLLVAVRSAGDNYKIGINKLKQKGKDNTLESELDANLIPQTKPYGRLSQWKNRRIERKKLKALKRLDKFSIN